MQYRLKEHQNHLPPIMVAGVEQTFYALSPYDRLEIIDAIKSRRLAAKKANLQAAGIAPDQQYVELEAFEENWDDEREWIAWVNSPRSLSEIAERSLRKEDKAEAKRIVGQLSLPHREQLEFKAALTNLELTAPEPAADGVNPPKPPATYGTLGDPATTSPTPAVYGTTTPA